MLRAKPELVENKYLTRERGVSNPAAGERGVSNPAAGRGEYLTRQRGEGSI